jgi:hypothetical protein
MLKYTFCLYIKDNYSRAEKTIEHKLAPFSTGHQHNFQALLELHELPQQQFVK